MPTEMVMICCCVFGTVCSAKKKEKEAMTSKEWPESLYSFSHYQNGFAKRMINQLAALVENKTDRQNKSDRQNVCPITFQGLSEGFVRALPC